MGSLLQNLIALGVVAAVVTLFARSRWHSRRQRQNRAQAGCGSGCGDCVAPTRGCATSNEPSPMQSSQH
ncbi:MAG: FeoB-associated Cys-rich membrane protein [Chromatiales bacterium]